MECPFLKLRIISMLVETFARDVGIALGIKNNCQSTGTRPTNPAIRWSPKSASDHLAQNKGF